jgi:predicted DCC family thiol-disulfide oxidoreductase YuxK
VDLLDQIGGRTLVVFDGRCGFCNWSIRWLLRRDRRDRLRFIPYESPLVAEVLGKHGFEPATLDPSSILVLRPASSPARAETVLVRSDAVIALLRALPAPWPAVAMVLSWLPRGLRDAGYRLVARIRFRLGKRLATCPIPTPAERARFVEY